MLGWGRSERGLQYFWSARWNPQIGYTDMNNVSIFWWKELTYVSHPVNIYLRFSWNPEASALRSQEKPTRNISWKSFCWILQFICRNNYLLTDSTWVAYIFSKFPWKSEANASKFQENFEEMFKWLYNLIKTISYMLFIHTGSCAKRGDILSIMLITRTSLLQNYWTKTLGILDYSKPKSVLNAVAKQQLYVLLSR